MKQPSQSLNRWSYPVSYLRSMLFLYWDFFLSLAYSVYLSDLCEVSLVPGDYADLVLFFRATSKCWEKASCPSSRWLWRPSSSADGLRRRSRVLEERVCSPLKPLLLNKISEKLTLVVGVFHVTLSSTSDSVLIETCILCLRLTLQRLQPWILSMVLLGCWFVAHHSNSNIYH